MKKNWEIKKLGDVCDFEGGSQPPKSNFIFEPRKGYVRFLQIRDFGSDKNITYIPESKKNRHCAEEDILLGRYGASVGKVLTNRKGAYNVAVMKTIPNESVLSKRYLLFYLTSTLFQGLLSRVASRSAQAGFSKDDIYNFPIPLPPLQEQKRIVTLLDEAFFAIAKAKENTEENLQNAQELFESYLQGVFANPGKGWEVKKLGEVCNIIGGGTPSKANNKYYGGDIYWATVRDMNSELILDTEHKITSEAVKDSSTNVITKGNVIIATRVGLGKICILQNDTAINQDLKGIIPKSTKVLSVGYLYRWLKSIAHIIKKEGTGATVQGVKLPFIQSLLIPVPTMKEQLIIIAKLDALSAETKKLESIYEQKLVNLEELKKSILQRAFNGELKGA